MTPLVFPLLPLPILLKCEFSLSCRNVVIWHTICLKFEYAVVPDVSPLSEYDEYYLLRFVCMHVGHHFSSVNITKFLYFRLSYLGVFIISDLILRMLTMFLYWCLYLLIVAHQVCCPIFINLFI